MSAGCIASFHIAIGAAHPHIGLRSFLGGIYNLTLCTGRGLGKTSHAAGARWPFPPLGRASRLVPPYLLSKAGCQVGRRSQSGWTALDPPADECNRNVLMQ